MHLNQTILTAESTAPNMDWPPRSRLVFSALQLYLLVNNREHNLESQYKRQLFLSFLHTLA